MRVEINGWEDTVVVGKDQWLEVKISGRMKIGGPWGRSVVGGEDRRLVMKVGD